MEGYYFKGQGHPGPVPERRGTRTFLCLLCLTLLITGCRYPRDVEGTLDRVEDGILRVGVTENTPWVIQTPEGAAGLEPEIITELADQLGATIEWHWGSESELVRALEQFELDLVVGGLTKGDNLAKSVASTRPYFNSQVTVGFLEDPPGQREQLEGMTIGVEAVNHLSKLLRDQGARPVSLGQQDTESLPVAAPTWWLETHGFEPAEWELTRRQHILLLPPGENAWMMAVQRHLDSLDDLGSRLRSLEASG